MEKKKIEVSHLVEEMGAAKMPRFKGKKWGVIPPKRRSVKRMMLDKMVDSVSCVFHACGLMAGEMLKMVPHEKARIIPIPRKDHLLGVARQNIDASLQLPNI